MIGHLTFNADFESGNLGRVVSAGNNEYDLFIRVDTCNQNRVSQVKVKFTAAGLAGFESF